MATKTKKRITLLTKKVSPPTAQPNDDFNRKLAHIAELQNGLEILKGRMKQSKTELIQYFDQHPSLKQNKYPVGNCFIRYVDRKSNDGLSQRLIMKGLSTYFKNQGGQNVENQVAEALSTILSQRTTRVTPKIDVVKGKNGIVSEDSDDNI